MKQSLSALFLFFFTLYFSQNQLQVLNYNNQKPVSNASVFCDDQLIGKTDHNGHLSFKTKCKKVEVLANNFEHQEAEVQKVMKISLQPSSEKSSNIDRITITDKSDSKALKILDELNKRYKDNAPNSLDAYQFKSYSKISLDVDKDSIDVYKSFLAKREDSLASANKRTFKQKDKEKKDSLLGEDFIKATKDSQFFIWEKASEHYFSKKFGDKTNIIDSRMSGFPNPIYELMAVNVSYLNRIPRQVKPENRKLFRYYLNDTINIDGRKTYVIKFKEVTDKTKQNPRKFNGKIYVDADTYALKKLETTSKKQNEGNVTVIWKPINNKWFLESENLKAKMGSQSFEIAKKDSIKPAEKQKFKTKKFGNFLYVKNQYFDFKINEPQKSSDYKGYSLEVKNADGSLLSQYRTDTLTARELATYNKIDTLVKKADFAKKVSLITNLLKGNLRYKIINFDINRLYDYNRFEGIRLGVGVKLNEKFSKTFSPDFYVGYGFKDHTWKYGIGLDTKLSQKRTSIFRIHYLDDVFGAGNFSKTFWDTPMKIGDIALDKFNGNYYKNQQFGASYQYDISNTLSAKLSLNKEHQQAGFDYQYQNYQNDFKIFNTAFSLKYAPKDKNLMTPAGKLTYERGFPVFFLNFEKGMEFLGGEFNYNRLDILGIYEFKNKLGTTNLKLFGGLSSGNAPIWKKFGISGQTDALSDRFIGKINSPSQLGFATMPSGWFYADQFAGFHIIQTLPFRFKTFGKRFSDIQLKYKSAIGDFKNPENHHFNFMVLDHYYQETGLMWNRFLGTGFGLGFYYRLGHYQTPNFKDNLGIEVSMLNF